MHVVSNVNYTLKQVKVLRLCAWSGFMKFWADVYDSEWINEQFSLINFVISIGQATWVDTHMIWSKIRCFCNTWEYFLFLKHPIILNGPMVQLFWHYKTQIQEMLFLFFTFHKIVGIGGGGYPIPAAIMTANNNKMNNLST